jgi:hypothetical protein
MFTRQQVINLHDSSLTSVTRQLTTTNCVFELVWGHWSAVIVGWYGTLAPATEFSDICFLIKHSVDPTSVRGTYNITTATDVTNFVILAYEKHIVLLLVFFFYL